MWGATGISFGLYASDLPDMVQSSISFFADDRKIFAKAYRDGSYH